MRTADYFWKNRLSGRFSRLKPVFLEFFAETPLFLDFFPGAFRNFFLRGLGPETVPLNMKKSRTAKSQYFEFSRLSPLIFPKHRYSPLFFHCFLNNDPDRIRSSKLALSHLHRCVTSSQNGFLEKIHIRGFLGKSVFWNFFRKIPRYFLAGGSALEKDVGDRLAYGIASPLCLLERCGQTQR